MEPVYWSSKEQHSSAIQMTNSWNSYFLAILSHQLNFLSSHSPISIFSNFYSGHAFLLPYFHILPSFRCSNNWNQLHREGGWRKDRKTEFNIENSKYLDCLFPVHQFPLVALKGKVKNFLIYKAFWLFSILLNYCHFKFSRPFLSNSPTLSGQSTLLYSHPPIDPFSDPSIFPAMHSSIPHFSQISHSGPQGRDDENTPGRLCLT